jgi:hypothetical protein
VGIHSKQVVAVCWKGHCIGNAQPKDKFSLNLSSMAAMRRFSVLHQGGRKPVHIKMTLFGLYLIRYQPHLSVFESF